MKKKKDENKKKRGKTKKQKGEKQKTKKNRSFKFIYYDFMITKLKQYTFGHFIGDRYILTGI